MMRSRSGGIRERLKNQNLSERTKQSYKTRDDKGTQAKNFFDPDKLQDEGVNLWWPNDGDHIIDIIPYLAGKKDPNAKEDEATYFLSVWVHRNVGPTNELIVCPDQYGDFCPICAERDKRRQNKEDWEDRIKPLKPSRRVVYNVIVRDGGEQEKKGVQVLEIAHFFMEKHLSQIARNTRTGDFTVFSDPDTGKSICFNRKSNDGNVEVTGHKFEERPEPITNAELEETFCLDELLLIRSAEEIAELFFAEKPADETGAPSSSGKSGDAPQTRVTADELMEMSKRDLMELIEEFQLSISTRGVGTDDIRAEVADALGIALPTTAPPPPPPPAEEEQPPEQEEAPPPPPRRRRRLESEGHEPPPEGAGLPGEEPGPAPGEEPEPEPPPAPRERRRPAPAPEPEEKPASKKGSGTCPHGGNFGKDCDDLDQCPSCSVYDDCAELAYGD